eukprot:IDg4072t1
MHPIDVCFKRMQGLSTVVSEQDPMLDKLASDLKGRSVRDLFADLGHFALSRFTALADEDKRHLESAVGSCFSRLWNVSHLSAPSVETVTRYRRTKSRLFFHTISCLYRLGVQSIVHKQGRRLAQCGREELCADLEREFKEFKDAIRDDKALRDALESLPSIVSFADSWRPVGLRFRKLRQFCGGIATVFPGTSTVESDFSVINWEYDEFCTSLTEFSLEGILQCKQFKRLQDMKHEPLFSLNKHCTSKIHLKPGHSIFSILDR